MAKRSIISIEGIQRSILLICGEKVLLDADLAGYYGIETKALVRAMKRNNDRFPPDFMFWLTKSEFDDLASSLRSKTGTSSGDGADWGGGH